MKLIKHFGFKRIYEVDVFGKEYRALFGKSQQDFKRCVTRLETNLKILDIEGIDDSLMYQQFEKLSGYDLYAIRDVGKLNPRVILATAVGGNIVLLTSFKEKSHNDYDKAIQKALERVKVLEENDKG